MTLHRLVSPSALLDEIAQVIGREATLDLCIVFGGTRLYVPKKLHPSHGIVQTIGSDAAAKLSEFSGGVALDLPKANVRRETAIRMVTNQGLSIVEAARRTYYSQRQLRRVLNNPPKNYW